MTCLRNLLVVVGWCKSWGQGQRQMQRSDGGAADDVDNRWKTIWGCGPGWDVVGLVEGTGSVGLWLDVMPEVAVLGWVGRSCETMWLTSPFWFGVTGRRVKVIGRSSCWLILLGFPVDVLGLSCTRHVGCSRTVVGWSLWTVVAAWRGTQGSKGEEWFSCRIQIVGVRSRVRGGKRKHRRERRGHGKRFTVKKIKATEMSSVRKDSVLKPIWGERQLTEDWQESDGGESQGLVLERDGGALGEIGDVLRAFLRLPGFVWQWQNNSELGDMRKLMGKAAGAQRMADIAMAGLSHTRPTCRKLATSFDEAECDLNEGLHKIHQLVAAAASATGASSCGTGVRMENELQYLQKAMRTLELTQNEDEGGYEVIAVTACRSWWWCLHRIWGEFELADVEPKMEGVFVATWEWLLVKVEEFEVVEDWIREARTSLAHEVWFSLLDVAGVVASTCARLSDPSLNASHLISSLYSWLVHSLYCGRNSKTLPFSK